MRTVYLDNSATTPVDERVFEAMRPYFTEGYANPNSLYAIARKTHAALEDARELFAAEIGAADPSEVVFTGCGTESDNAAVLGIARAVKRDSQRDRVVVSSFEHKAILEPAKLLEKEGFEVTYLVPREDGLVHPEDLEKVIGEKTALVSVMHVNNELGTIQPVHELAETTHRVGALFHTDAVQAVGKIDFDVKALGMDAASFSAHKIYGPKGVGALYLKKRTPFLPLLVGGGQESKKRGGTQNVAGAVGIAEALKIMNAERLEESKRLRALRDKVIDTVLGEIENTLLNGDRTHLAPHVANLIIKGIEGESLLLQLDDKGVMVSTGSACSSGSLEPSHVLLAIGRPPELAHGSMRVSLGRFTTEDDIDYFLEVLGPIVQRLRDMSPMYERMYGSG